MHPRPNMPCGSRVPTRWPHGFCPAMYAQLYKRARPLAAPVRSGAVANVPLAMLPQHSAHSRLRHHPIKSAYLPT